MIVLDMPQGSAEWMAARAGKLSASRFPELMATLRNGKHGAGFDNVVADATLERLTGRKLDTFQSEWMARGIMLEDEARRFYEDANLTVVNQIGMAVHSVLDYVSCSPDGLLPDEVGLVEFKCPKHATHLKYLLNPKTLLADYRWQVQGQMWVCDREYCDLVSYDPDFPEHLRLVTVRVEADEDDWMALRKTCVDANVQIEKNLEALNALD